MMDGNEKYRKASPPADYDSVQFNLNNPTANTVQVDLFGADPLTTFPSQNAAGVRPDTVGAQLTVGVGFEGISYYPDTRTIYASRPSAPLIVRTLDPVTKVATGQFAASVGAHQMLYVDSVQKIYMTGINVNATGETLSVIDPVTNSEFTSVTFPAGAALNKMAFCSQLNKLYIADTSATRIFVLDVTTNTIINTIVAPDISSFSVSLAYDEAQNKIYSAAFTTGDIDVINCNTDTAVATLALPSVQNVLYNSTQNLIYAFNTATFDIRRINPVTDTFIAGTIGAFTSSVNDAVYDANSDVAYYADNSVGIIRVVDGATFAMLAPIIFGIALNKQDLVFASNINTLYGTVGLSGNYVAEIFASGSQVFIDGSTSYEIFKQDAFTNPKQIGRIEIYAQNNQQLTNEVVIQRKDANGKAYRAPKLPNVHFSTGQFQDGIAQLNYDKLILDTNTTILQYTLEPFSEVKAVFFYKEIKRVDFLSRPYTLQLDALYSPDANTFTPAEMRASNWQKPMKPAMASRTWALKQQGNQGMNGSEL